MTSEMWRLKYDVRSVKSIIGRYIGSNTGCYLWLNAIMKFVFLFCFVDVKESNTRPDIFTPILIMFALVFSLVLVVFIILWSRSEGNYMYDVWGMTSEIWRLKYDIWNMTSEVGRLKYDVWDVTSEVWCEKCEVYYWKIYRV
jgi:hypothetical protein